MKIIDFEYIHIKEACELALENYMEERRNNLALPDISEIPDLSIFAQNGLGVVAVEEERLIGFLCCYEPWEHAFDSEAVGTFSPMHAHGAVKENRGMIYKRMYQYAAQKWVNRKIAYHTIALYAHDYEAIQGLFSYGFGLRCVDAIRDMSYIKEPYLYKQLGMEVEFEELPQEKIQDVREIRKMLSDHMGMSPCFMYSSDEQFTSWIVRAEKRDSRVFVGKEKDKVIAYLEIQDTGENFATEVTDMKNICGAFCLPEYRGKSIHQGLINYVIEILKKEGIQRLGVDFEGFNPTASGFWLKYFDAYTNSVVRRIDECAILKDR